jgi:hypothetical protein
MMLTIPKRWRNLNQEFAGIQDKLIQSVLKDAVATNGWSIDKEYNIHTCERQSTIERKKSSQKILNARVIEQFADPADELKFRRMRERYISRFVPVHDFPENVDEITKMFRSVKITPVESDGQKDLYRFLRHTWRLPFNTTPGRTLSFIVTAGEEQKAIGIFSLASPAMWMASRDEHLGYEKLDRLEISKTGNRKNYEDKHSWVQRWKRCGMLEDGKHPHPLSGKYTVSEFIGSLKSTLLERIKQFPVFCFKDRPDLIQRATKHGIKVKDTKPSWINGIEPSSTKTQREHIKKRRRITEKCLDALDALNPSPNSPWPNSIESLYDLLHDSGDNGAALKAMKYGLREAKTKRISGDIAELVICGALPPLNKLRVGKLVAMLALSKETQMAWNKKYSNSDSKIASDLAGKSIRKKADLSSISTTGLYGASNAQYSRVRIPLTLGQTLRWEMVGLTGRAGKGPSNLMLSSKTWAHIKSYSATSKIEGVSGKFGEGTSARIRRMKSVFSHLDEHSSRHGYAKPGEVNRLLNRLVENPFSRSVHVANLSPNSVRYNLNIDSELSDQVTTPSVETIVEFWKQRWLTPFLSRSPEFRQQIVREIRSIDLSGCLPPFTGDVIN